MRIFRDPDRNATDPERAFRVDVIAEGTAEISPLCQPAAKTAAEALLPPAGF